MRAPFGNFVDFQRGHVMRLEKARGAARRLNLEAEGEKPSHRLQYARLVDVAPRDEHSAGARPAGAAAEPAFGEGDVARPGEPHHFAGRAHFRAEHRIDAGEARERKPRLLDADMVDRLELEFER